MSARRGHDTAGTASAEGRRDATRGRRDIRWMRAAAHRMRVCRVAPPDRSAACVAATALSRRRRDRQAPGPHRAHGLHVRPDTNRDDRTLPSVRRGSPIDGQKNGPPVRPGRPVEKNRRHRIRERRRSVPTRRRRRIAPTRTSVEDSVPCIPRTGHARLDGDGGSTHGRPGRVRSRVAVIDLGWRPVAAR